MWGALDATLHPEPASASAPVGRRMAVGVQLVGAPLGLGFLAALGLLRAFAAPAGRGGADRAPEWLRLPARSSACGERQAASSMRETGNEVTWPTPTSTGTAGTLAKWIARSSRHPRTSQTALRPSPIARRGGCRRSRRAASTTRATSRARPRPNRKASSRRRSNVSPPRYPSAAAATSQTDNSPSGNDRRGDHHRLAGHDRGRTASTAQAPRTARLVRGGACSCGRTNSPSTGAIADGNQSAARKDAPPRPPTGQRTRPRSPAESSAGSDRPSGKPVLSQAAGALARLGHRHRMAAGYNEGLFSSLRFSASSSRPAIRARPGRATARPAKRTSRRGLGGSVPG
jgi:hypothetical protein